MSHKITPEQIKELMDELKVLSKHQATGFGSGINFKMTLRHAEDYDLRQQRIVEIRSELEASKINDKSE
jgi:hypothetical protein